MIEVSAITTSPDETKAIEAINAIYDYVRAQRIKVSKYPKLLPLIKAFESWYQGLEASHDGIFGHTIDINDSNEAKRQRFAINEVMGQRIPDDITPADAPQTPPPVPPEGMPWGTIGALAVLGTVALLLLRK